MSDLGVHEEEPVPLSRLECLAYLRSSSEGHLAYSRDGLLVVTPIVFDFVGGRIRLVATPRSVLGHAVGQVVTLQCDGVERLGARRWSVCATGFVGRGHHEEMLLDPELFKGYWAERSARRSA